VAIIAEYLPGRCFPRTVVAIAAAGERRCAMRRGAFADGVACPLAKRERTRGAASSHAASEQ
jgi:hypothetical protein